MSLVARIPNAPQNYDAQNEAQFRNLMRQALTDTSSPLVLQEAIAQTFQGVLGDALVHDGGEFLASKIFSAEMTFAAGLILNDDADLSFGTGLDYFMRYVLADTSMQFWSTNVNGAGADGKIFEIQDGTDDIVFTGEVASTGGFNGTVGSGTPAAGTFTTLNATGGGALTGTWTDLGSVTTVDINGGTADGVVIGGVSAAAGTFTTLNATGGGALTGTWTDLGTVTTVDINGGTADGVVIGGAVAAAGTFTTLNATGGGALTGTWTDLGSVTTVDINGGTIDGAVIGGVAAGAGTFTTLNATGGGALTGTWTDLGTVTTVDINGGTVDGTTIGGAAAAAGTFTTLNATGGGALTGTWTDLGTVTTVDINGGTIDGAVIGGASAAAGTFTTLNATGGGALTGTWTDLGTVTTVDINGGTIDGATIGGAVAAAGTFTGLTVDSGTAANPTYKFDGTSTGFYGSTTQLNFTVAGVRVGYWTASWLTVEDPTAAALQFVELDAGANETRYQFLHSAGDFYLQGISDDGLTFTTAMRFFRTANTFDKVEFYQGVYISKPLTVMLRGTNTANTDESWDFRISATGQYELRSVTDAGTTVLAPLQIEHATGIATFSQGVTSLNIEQDNVVLTLKDTLSATNAAQSGKIEFTDQSDNVDGSVGFLSAADTDFTIDNALGDLSFATGGTERLAISSTAATFATAVVQAQGSVSASTDALDVTDVNSIAVSTSGGTVTIGGLANGVVGQRVVLFKTTSANSLIIEHNESTGTQKIITPAGADITFTTFGGVEMEYNGSFWFVISE